MSLIVDASVAIKWFSPEDLHEQAMDVMLRHAPGLAAPDLIIAEVSNVVWKKTLRGEFARHKAPLVMRAMRICLPTLYPSTVLADRALAIALVVEHPTYDCLYLACAEANHANLVTADRRLHEAVQGTPWAPLVIHLSDISALAGGETYLPGLPIAVEKVEYLIRTRHMIEMTGESLEEAFGSRGRWTSLASDEARMLRESIGMQRLHRYLETLPASEKAALLALGWLGQGVSGTDWTALLERAGETHFADDVYLVRISVHFEAGLARLRTMNAEA